MAIFPNSVAEAAGVKIVLLGLIAKCIVSLIFMLGKFV